MYRRWNHARREMEDWWPGKCCGRAYFHNSNMCERPTTKWEITVPITLPAIGQTGPVGPSERPHSCPRCNAMVDTVYAATQCSDTWHTRGRLHVHNTYEPVTRAYTYRPEYPFDGINKVKYPRTWWTLCLMYFSGSWWQDTKYVHYKKDPPGTETIVSYEQAY